MPKCGGERNDRLSPMCRLLQIHRSHERLVGRRGKVHGPTAEPRHRQHLPAAQCPTAFGEPLPQAPKFLGWRAGGPVAGLVSLGSERADRNKGLKRFRIPNHPRIKQLILEPVRTSSLQFNLPIRLALHKGCVPEGTTSPADTLSSLHDHALLANVTGVQTHLPPCIFSLWAHRRSRATSHALEEPGQHVGRAVPVTRFEPMEAVPIDRRDTRSLVAGACDRQRLNS